jgi:Fic family protein
LSKKSLRGALIYRQFIGIIGGEVNADKMLIKFEPKYTLTPKLVTLLIQLEAAKEKVLHLPLNPLVLSSLRESARLFTTHYSTMIEGNRLEPGQIEAVLKHEGHFPGRERDEQEVRGYYEALVQVEKWVAAGTEISEASIEPNTGD